MSHEAGAKQENAALRARQLDVAESVRKTCSVQSTNLLPCSVCGMLPIVPRAHGGGDVIARSCAIQSLFKRVSRFARTEAPVVVYGETGTGKEVVARVLHANSSRADNPFVAINVAALPADLLESEIFGHGKGAFTGASVVKQGLFEVAHKGTIFLDEIGELPLTMQAKFLRVLQDGEMRRVGETQAFAVDVRVVCATHRDLAALVASGKFREDLYYRLNVLTVEVPPLRDREADILPLAEHFLSLERSESPGFTEQAEKCLLAYSWPGNVRELQNAVKHGAALAAGAKIDAEDLPDPVRLNRQSNASVALDLRSLAEVEKEHILRVLTACGGSQSDAAKILGVARNTLWRKLKDLGD